VRLLLLESLAAILGDFPHGLMTGALMLFTYLERVLRDCFRGNAKNAGYTRPFERIPEAKGRGRSTEGIYSSRLQKSSGALQSEAAPMNQLLRGSARQCWLVSRPTQLGAEQHE